MSVGRWMGKEVVLHVHGGILLSHKKEHIWVSFNEVDEPRAYSTEWSKSETEQQILNINTHIWDLERWYWWSYVQGSRGDRSKKQILDTVGEWRVECLERIALQHIHYHMWNSQPAGVWCVTQGPKASALWQPGGRGGEGECKRERTHIYLWLIHADVHGKNHYSTEK